MIPNPSRPPDSSALQDGTAPLPPWPELSVVVPMYNESDNVGVFYDLGTSFIGNAFSTSLYPVARSVSA